MKNLGASPEAFDWDRLRPVYCYPRRSSLQQQSRSELRGIRPKGNDLSAARAASLRNRLRLPLHIFKWTHPFWWRE